MASETDIAVVGVGCRYPDAWTPGDLWHNVETGTVSMRDLDDERLRAAGFTEKDWAAPEFVRRGTTLPGVAEFAADFFGYTPREAETIDPQQRIFLEACWEALEFAGHPPRGGGPVTAVFAGSAAGTYSAALFADKAAREGLAAAIADLDLTVGGQPDFLSSRTAYKLGLRGPALSVQTACSSGLYAVHYATLSLLSGECDLALAGGATVLEPLRGYRHLPGRAQSVDGYCRSFDARSSGTNYSSGVGVVALRRLGDALADGDPVLAVLAGSAVGNDGGDRLGYTAPSPAGVASVVATALRVAGVGGERLRYVEAHGTGTPVGDRIELQALTDAVRRTTDRVGFCALGSVMSNIGHTGPAAGVAGLIKAVHVVRTGAIPPHPTFERARDPGVLAESPFFVPTEPGRCTDADRVVLVNSIGVGGTNASVVLTPPPAPTRPAAAPRDVVRLVLSARTRTELDAMSRRLADVLDADPPAVADVAHTLRVGRRAFEERRVVTAAPTHLAAALRLPRPPAARTVRATPRRAVVVLHDSALAELAAELRAVLGAEITTGVPDGTFTIALGGGTPGPDTHVVPAEGDPADLLDEAAAAAWLHGVDVDWQRLAGGAGRRVALPTYPFTRNRYWALDRIGLDPAPVATAQPAEAGSLEEGVVAVWRQLFGAASVGVDDEFGALGGTSLLSVQMVLALQQKYGVTVNVHRAGGGRATPRRIAEMIRAMREDPGSAGPQMDRMDEGDDALIDADLRLPLGEVGAARAPGRGVLLTGATGYLGAFLLSELVKATRNRVYCLVRADDEAQAWERLRTAAARFALPEPDPERVRVVPGDLREIGTVARRYRDGELAAEVGHVLHCAARVVFTEPYRTLREHNVLPLVDLLAWMREHGVRDLSYVSSVAATGPAMGADARHLETREQALDPRAGGYGATKWVAERLLDRADQDGMRVRVFRPGLIMAASDTGAGNDKDLIYFTLVSGLAVGAHPADDRVLTMAPVDVVARAIAELAMTPGSVGRAYHLVGERGVSLRYLFEQLAAVGLPTEPVELAVWQKRVAERAMELGNPVLSTSALLEIEGHEGGDDTVQAGNWQPWLRRRGVDPGVTGEQLRRALAYLARTNDLIGALLPELAKQSTVDEMVEAR